MSSGSAQLLLLQQAIEKVERERNTTNEVIVNEISISVKQVFLFFLYFLNFITSDVREN
jgi:hypothetical protein